MFLPLYLKALISFSPYSVMYTIYQQNICTNHLSIKSEHKWSRKLYELRLEVLEQGFVFARYCLYLLWLSVNYLSVLKLIWFIRFFFQLLDYLLLLLFKSFSPQFHLFLSLLLLFLNSLLFSQLLQLSLFSLLLNNFCLQNLLKLLKLLFFSLAIMRHLFNDIFLPENSLVVLSFIDHNGQEANSKYSFDLFNFIRKVFLQS